ncbi:MAG TPA: hypothetical protein DC049_08790, partial [Spirochaetia bacterium]|nr:hypothetical protein [Spirochaetia bacterium]
CTVSTIYNGVSVPLQNSDFKKKFSFPFVFSSGNIKKHKNFISVIRAFAEFTKKGRHENVRLVIAGDTSDSSYTELINFSEKNLPGRVIFTGSIPDDEYFRLLRQAEVYLFLSRSEGFGYTPLEAMLCGTPVICSDAGALTESAGAGALCCSPFDTGQAAIFLQRLFSDRKFRLECITRGNRHARNFSVKKSGAAHYEIIKSLLRQDK